MRHTTIRAAGLALLSFLFLAGPARAAADSLRVATYPPRATMKGLKIGAAVGGVAGAGYLLLIGIVADALGDGGDDDFSTGDYLLLAAFGGVAGAASGAVIGADIGSMSYRSGIDRRRFPATPPIGRFGLEAGRAGFSQRNDAGPGFWVRGTLASHVTPWLATGPELTLQFADPRNVRTAWIARLEPWHGRVTPCLLGSIGPTFWPGSQNYLGGEVGGGVRFGGPAAGTAWQIEARHHWNLQNTEFGPGINGRYDYLTIGAGITHSW